MFDLEKLIADWRMQMLAAGIKSPVPLDELEGHLREEISQQIKAGLNAEAAFKCAAQNIGNADALRNEFKKVRRAPVVLERLMIGICFAFIALIVFLGGATVMMCFTSLGDRLMAAAGMTGTVLVACSWRYAVPFLPLVSGTWSRLAVGLTCIALGFGITGLYFNVILPHFEVRPDHQIPAIGFWAAFILAVFSCVGVGLALSKQDREKLGAKKLPFRRTASVET